MADFEVEDYQEFTEDDNYESQFFDYSGEDDRDDDYYSRSFDSMSESERSSNFGSMEFEELLNELDDVLNNSRKFFFKNKRIVDAQYFGGIIDDIKARTPAEIVNGRDIIARENDIIDQANRDADSIVAEANTYDTNTRNDADDYSDHTRAEADDYYDARVKEGEATKDQIIEDANREAERLTSEHQITINAKAEGKKIIDEAHKQAAEFVAATNQSVDEYKAKVNAWAEESMRAVVSYCFELLTETRKIAAENISSIDREMADAKQKFGQVKNQIGFVK